MHGNNVAYKVYFCIEVSFTIVNASGLKRTISIFVVTVSKSYTKCEPFWLKKVLRIQFVRLFSLRDVFVTLHHHNHNLPHYVSSNA